MGSDIILSCSLRYLKILEQGKTPCRWLTQYSLDTLWLASMYRRCERVKDIYLAMFLHADAPNEFGFRREGWKAVDMHGARDVCFQACVGVSVFSAAPFPAAWCRAAAHRNNGLSAGTLSREPLSTISRSISVTIPKCNFLLPPPELF